MIKEFVIDLFCGAGGTSTGVHLSNSGAEVIACVNHDPIAIASHKENHPRAKHFVEDIRNPEVVFFLANKVRALRKLYPGCIITLWASLECVNFSKAKGGMPRDADSRTLANDLFMYLNALSPDYLMIENVMEFMSWGPLDGNGKPISKRAGSDYIRWVNTIQSMGYDFDWRELNSADYGAYTSRTRYFAQFAKPSYPIVWPEQTHAKKALEVSPLFESYSLKKWKAVKDVLDLTQDGQSIFNRKKPLVENTLKRIYSGLLKFVANGDESFLKKYYSGQPESKVVSIDGPAGTITTSDHHAVIKCDFIMKYNSTSKSGVHIPPSIEEPCPVIATQNRLGKVSAHFMQSYYGNGGAHDINAPSPTLTTKDRLAKINYLMLNYSTGSNTRSIKQPAGTIVSNDKHNLVSVDRQFILNPQFGNNGNSIELPAPTIIARQDKKPLGLISCLFGNNEYIPIYDDDVETMIKIKVFMAHYGVCDIKMRMLSVQELLRIQGFPKNYKLKGSQTDQKKFIGNSVEVTLASKLFSAHYNKLNEQITLKKAG
jgi:DNA (cytosine-5)-methyltransferase 1